MANAALDLYDAFKASGMADAQARQATDALLRSHDHRLDDIENGQREGFEAVDRRFEAVDRRFEQIDQRFEQIDQRFEQIDQRFERIDQRFERIEARLSIVERDTMLLKWMVGFNLTITVAVLAKLLFG